MPRPPKSSDDKKSFTVIFRMCASEYDPLVSVAQKAALNPNSMARMLVAAGSKDVVIKPSRRADPAVIARLDRIISYLKLLATNNPVCGPSAPTVESICQELRCIIRESVHEAIPE